MDSTIIMRCLETAGRIIMENGGETYRAEDTVVRMGHAFGLEHVEVFAVPSGIFLSFSGPNGESESSVLRIFSRGTNLTRVDEVNTISRRCAQEHLEPAFVLNMLTELENRRPLLNGWHLVLAAGFSSAGFAVMFGGGAVDFCVALFVAAFAQMLTMLPERLRGSGMADTLIGSFVSTLLPIAFHQLTGLGTVDPIVAGALMPLLPGLAMTNAIRDALRGDMVSSLSHVMQAVMTATLVAGGALLAANLWRMIGGLLV